MNRASALAASVVSVSVLAGCVGLDLDRSNDIIHARFDPDDSAIPMPTDILRDAEAGRLDLPVDDEDNTPAEREFYEYLNTLDGWSSAQAARVEFTGALAPDTINPETVQVWHWDETPEMVDEARRSLNDTETELTIDAPRHGWERGGKYVVMVRGGAAGVEGKRGERVEADAAFYFLRLNEALNDGTHLRAFPGDTLAEKQETADDLEEIRLELAEYFEFFEGRGIPRDEVASLWEFTVTEKIELAMDKASQRIPIPIDLMINPETGKIDLPVTEWDSETTINAKAKLSELEGFGPSMGLMLSFTGKMDLDTLTPENIELFEVGPAGYAEQIGVDITVLDDREYVFLEPQIPLLKEETTYAVVVRDGVRAADGSEIVNMPAGHFLRAEEEIWRDGESLVGAVEAASARRLEGVRQVLSTVNVAHEPNVLAAWTFTTMNTRGPMRKWFEQPNLIGAEPDPSNIEHMSPGQALLDFPLNMSLFFTEEVIQGTIKTPNFLDDETRALRGDGGHEVIDIPFTLVIPKGVDPGEEIPVVIFGHGLMSERRFVLAVGDALANQGFATISIDFPFHGERSYCWSEGPLTIPDPTTGELTPIQDPCPDGYACQENGKCISESGEEAPLRKFPIVNMPQSSGAAMLEIEHIANTRDHFIQSYVDLKSLSRSIRTGDWESTIGYRFKQDKIYYTGQSLGGILGAVFVSMSPEVDRAVLNVPGADTVDLFENSQFFGFQVDAFFKREGVEQYSWEGRRFMNVAKWLMDSVDPHSFVGMLGDENRNVMVQMATLDFIIPNANTKRLVEIAGVPRRDYIAEHAFICLPVEPEYLRGVTELARYLVGEFEP